MSANSSPNLFRLSLPEWLKEQVDSGKHKGVYWINEKDRIFHVPWKHASRNGWEDGDVSLFKAWAIYTNRYRVGIDKPRPALWKTNFRCAINSHNSICFLKDQGQRKGDKAHRIMKLVDPPKKGRRVASSPDSDPGEPPRKLVRLTYPNFGPPPGSKAPHKGGKSSQQNSKYRSAQICDSCNDIKTRLHYILESSNDEENNENNQEYLDLKTKYVECITSKEHICHDKSINELIDSLSDTKAFVRSQDSKPKHNLLNDLYFIGKALQSNDDLTTLTVEVKTENNAEDLNSVDADKFDSSVKKAIIEQVGQLSAEHCIAADTDSKMSPINEKEVANIEVSEEEDDLITPRDV